MKVAILYSKLYEFDGTVLSIGGIQTYLLRLSELVLDMGWEPAIFQLGATDFERDVGRTRIIGKSGIPLTSAASEVGAFLTRHAENWIHGGEGIIIYSSDFLFTKSLSNSIAIQHGVTWDVPPTYDAGVPAKLLHFLPHRLHEQAQDLITKFRCSRINELRRTWLETGSEHSRAQRSIRFMVCVDYNYLNARKAQGRSSNARTWIIPNCADLAGPEEIAGRRKGATPVKILFARRFVWYRGTRLIAPVFKRILDVCPDVCITFAGEGPDEDFLRRYFVDTDRVSFLKYNHDESTGFLLSHDITVIPSLGSEGTSLSAIEAMAAGCAVVATCVGGLTNIIIDNYNGKLVLPAEEDLFSALYQVVTDAELRHSLAERAYATVKESLNTDLWRERWRRVLLHVSQLQQ